MTGGAVLILCLLVWLVEKRRSPDPGVRGWLAGMLTGGFLVWAAAFIFGLTRAENAILVRALCGFAFAVPGFLYVRHVGRRLRDRVRVSDGMLLLGVFLILPGFYLAPLLVLGRAASILTCAIVGLYYGTFGFIALATAWSKGRKAGTKVGAGAANETQPEATP